VQGVHRAIISSKSVKNLRIKSMGARREYELIWRENRPRPFEVKKFKDHEK
jgi:hypothetical protein